MSIGVKAETRILLILIALFLIGGVVSRALEQPEVITATYVSLMVTACLYRFLGGVEGSRLTVASFKAGGSVAVFGAVLWFVNDELEGPEIVPATAGRSSIPRARCSEVFLPHRAARPLCRPRRRSQTADISFRLPSKNSSPIGETSNGRRQTASSSGDSPQGGERA